MFFSNEISRMAVEGIPSVSLEEVVGEIEGKSGKSSENQLSNTSQ
jgi:hypothetical protein